MNSRPMSPQNLRRSQRTLTPSRRVQENQALKTFTSSQAGFPRKQDVILVKWNLGRRSTWWEATVANINSISNSCSSHLFSRNGILQYHKRGQYMPEKAFVQFTYDNTTKERLVRSVVEWSSSKDKSPSIRDSVTDSSWMFKHESSKISAETEITLNVSEVLPTSSNRATVPDPLRVLSRTRKKINKPVLQSSQNPKVSMMRNTRSRSAGQIQKAPPSPIAIRRVPAHPSLRKGGLKLRQQQRRREVSPNLSQPECQIEARGLSTTAASHREPYLPATSKAPYQALFVPMTAQVPDHEPPMRPVPATTKADNQHVPELSLAHNLPRDNPMPSKARNRTLERNAINEENIHTRFAPVSNEVDHEAREPASDPTPNPSNSNGSSGRANDDNTLESNEIRDLKSRISQLERVVNSGTSARISRDVISPSSQPTSVSSVILFLRWALLKSLEKPLKRLTLPDLGTYGIGRTTTVVNTKCDYITFKHLSSSLAAQHGYTGFQSKGNRLAFSPPFHLTQTGSNAADDLRIIFSHLADVATFLRIRDDRDYERILSKEHDCKTNSFFRVLGTYKIENENSNSNIHEVSLSTDSISITSRSSPLIRVFVGSCPVDYSVLTEVERFRAERDKSEECINRKKHISVVIEQKCTAFCRTQKCFLSGWNCTNVTSNFNTRCEFDLDGTVFEEYLSDYFTLTWKRDQSPSTTKWTKDVQEVDSNSPGTLSLSLPTVFLSARRNVRSFVRILDTQIENFLDIRSTVHP